MLSQFFILSSRGDTLAFRDYRGDVVRGTPEIFYRRIQSLKTQVSQPIFHVEGTQFLYIIQSGLYFVCTTKENVSPVFVLELLNKIASLCKDFCGSVNEESIRMNFPLVYEILDEILDFGYPQCTSTETLKDYVRNSAHSGQKTGVSFVSSSASVVFGNERRAIPSSSPDKSVIESKKTGGKSEIYIDIVETMTVILAANGQPIRSEIDGCIKVRSFLAGKPEIRMGLNDNILVKNSDSGNQHMGHNVKPIVLDDCCFHDCVEVEAFERNRLLLFHTQAGTCSVMTYRINGNFPLPFRLIPFMEILGDTQIGLRLTLKCEVPKMFHAVSIAVRVPAPQTTTAVTHEVSTGPNTMEYNTKEKLATWSIRKMIGGTEHTAFIKFSVPVVTKISKKQVGPVSLSFEFPMYVSTGIQVKNLKVVDQNNVYTPNRWIRYITHSNSYVIRL